jgi:hypothetical protein
VKLRERDNKIAIWTGGYRRREVMEVKRAQKARTGERVEQAHGINIAYTVYWAQSNGLCLPCGPYRLNTVQGEC